MRLFPHPSAGDVSALTHPTTGASIDVGTDGGFDLDDDAATRLHRFHVGGNPLWETDIERQHRLMDEENARRQDPATLLDAVQQLVELAAAQGASAVAEQPVKRTPGRPRKTD